VGEMSPNLPSYLVKRYSCVYKHFLTTSCVAMSLSDKEVCATRVNLCVGVTDEQ